MKIALVLFGTTGRGGTETVLIQMARALRHEHHKVRIFLLGGSADIGWIEGLDVTVLGSPKDSKTKRYFRYMTQFPILFRSFNPDVALGLETRATFFIARVSRLLGMRTRIGSWLHFTLDKVAPLEYLRYASFHLAISSGIADQLRQYLGPQAHIHTVFNPCESNVAPISRAQTPTFLYVGRLTHGGQKRTDDLFQAAARLRGAFRIQIVGDGTDGAELRQLATDLGLGDRVEWSGWQKDPWTVVREASVLVMTSEYEGFPMVLVEALARGVPVLASDCPTGPNDIVKDQRNGRLLPVGDIHALTSAMQNVVDAPNDLPSPQAVIASVKLFGIPETVARFLYAFQEESSR